ncbi:hypothetical protein M231_05824 [Tremella mesenterica]|uniref:NADH dehydrogenase (Ubiquinone) 1 beta subcomplex 8 n=1 Tax=Tremella mesenterica TaxID=5217 RepID=A0A4Q1BH57_TREME|nr:hypothetical protein M231_05824 [Tremella mesenterica]
MLRSSLLRTVRPVRCSPMTAARRCASTHEPTVSSGPGNSMGIDAPLPPGEEIDPQLNGYPQLPYVSLQSRSPFGWWDQQERKNFGEVVHEEEDRLGMWGPDVHRISGGSALMQLGLAFSLIGLFAYGLSITRPQRPVAQRTYSYGGLAVELGGNAIARAEEDGMDE